MANVSKGKLHTIQRSPDLINWSPVHTFTPATWQDYSWTDGTLTPGEDAPVFYRTEMP